MDILNGVINSQISTDEILEWLTADNSQSAPFLDILKTDVTRTEFIIYFLDYVKKQCQRTLNIGTNDALESQPKKNQFSTPSKQNNKISLEKEFTDASISGQSTPLKIISTSSNSRPPIPEQYPNTSPSLYSPFKAFGNSSWNNLNQSQNSTNFVNSLSSFPELSSPSQQIKNPLISLNDSTISHSSMASSTGPCSPISPLYNTNMRRNDDDKINILTPKREPRDENFQKKYSPMQNQNSNQKKKNTSGSNHNRSFCLADFLTVEVSNSKKSGKKNQSLELKSKNDDDENSSMNESLNKSGKKFKSKRRIKPTKLNTSNNSENQQQQVFGVVNRPSIINPQFAEAQSEDKSNETASFEAERELLKLERQRPKPQIEVVETIDQEHSSCQIKPKPMVINIVPKLELVKNLEILNILANIYSGLLRKNLVPNLMTELYFIISLITYQYKFQNDLKEEQEINSKKCNNDDDLILQDTLEQLKINCGCKDIDVLEKSENLKDNQESFQITNDELSNNINDVKKEKNYKKKSKKISEKIDYLKTAHNCVYFATKILDNEKQLLVILDRTALKLLSDNYHVISFQPELQKYLNELYKDKCLQLKQTEPYNDASTLQLNVCFQVETDNRENFPSSQAFNTFKKQRDLFYEILKSWEDQHLHPNWSFGLSLETKINAMLNLHSNTINYYHIAQLFKSQLLISSIEHKQMVINNEKNNQVNEQPVNDESLSILKDVKHLNPKKLMQLKERLVTPVTSTTMSPVPSPTFPGVQEFYRDFLLTSSDSKFHTILEHCFIQEIMELNETHFACINIDTNDNTVDESTKRNYLLSISSLRLIAKFLGLLVSMPYRSQINSVDVINTQIALRSRIIPSLNLQDCLYNALKNGKLSLTIPWMVQYLAMLDSISFRLPYYIQLCEILYCIYRSAQDYMDHKTALLITFSIGWLFELSNFPKDLYYKWCSNYDGKKIKITSETIDDIKKNESMSQLMIKEMIEETKDSFKEQNLILDKMEIIDDRALYACCPFLKVFRVLLTSGNLNINNNNNANRHITPVSSQLSQPSSVTKTMVLQLQLQEAFFSGKPKSVKKTVDFISERIASSCVKYICRSVIPKYEDDYCKAWKKLVEEPEEKKNTTINKQRIDISLITKNMKTQCKEAVIEMIKIRTTNAMESLLADDVIPAVSDMCKKISQKMTMERIDQWLDSYINNMVNSYMNENNIPNKTRNENPDDEIDDADKIEKQKIIFHNSEAPCSTYVMKELRYSLWELIEKHGRWALLTEDQTLINIENLRLNLFERNDTTPCIRHILCTMSVDYALHIIVFKMELMTINVENNFIQMWKLISDVQNYFNYLLSPRNVRLFMESYDKTVWPRYGKFIGRLLVENILSWDKFSEQCVAILRLEWPANVLKLIPTCLMETLNYFKSTNEHTEKIKYLIEWTAETCADLNNHPI